MWLCAKWSEQREVLQDRRRVHDVRGSSGAAVGLSGGLAPGSSKQLVVGVLPGQLEKDEIS